MQVVQKFNDPFFHVIIDNFLEKDLASALSNEFIAYDRPEWLFYNNPVENKKTLNNYYYFPETTYNFFCHLNSSEFIDKLESITGISGLIPDYGLHGGGWHIHGDGGKLNVHLDYDLHPKLNLQRKLNLILYLSEDWDSKWGGNLEFWSHNKELNEPLKKEVEIQNIFNRAVLFDTTQNSWHGFFDPITCPNNKYRKSIAVYYHIKPSDQISSRKRAFYALDKYQKDNESIKEFVKARMLI